VQERQVADDEPGAIQLRGLEIFRGGARIADVRAGQRDNLARVGRVGKNLLIARERGVENDFACGVAFGSYRLAAEDGSSASASTAGKLT